VTTTFLAPTVPAGVVQVIDVAETTVTDVQALPPTVTVAPAAKFVPVIVIAVPPAVDPVDGEMPVTVGAEMDGASATTDVTAEFAVTPAGLCEFVALTTTRMVFASSLAVRTYVLDVADEIFKQFAPAASHLCHW
jgi:hypothetical protein